jgi:hypothetical protein
MSRRTKLATGLVLLLALVIVAVPVQEALALIMGGEGNRPLQDPGWPKGAAAIFNNTHRIAYWEGPPFGGGQWHAECRGDTKALHDVLAAFSDLEVKSKRVVLHDGVGHSFWLNPNNEPGKRDAAKIDWIFMIWQPDHWQRLRNLPADLNPTNPKDAADGPPSQIDVYTGGNIRWADVIVPKGLKIVDDRLEAHGFTLADGVVLQGKVTDLETSKPVTAKVRLERVEPQKKGGYRYPTVAVTTTDAQGDWVMKKTAEGWYRLVVQADNYVPRLVGFAKFDDQPRWLVYDCGLARAGPVSGRVLDDAGQPLMNVDVRIGDVTTLSGDRYQSPSEAPLKTDADGRFRATDVPVGKASIWVSKPGYVRPGLGLKITTPKSDVELTMTKASRIVVTVDFTGKNRPAGYIVNLQPEGGDRIGTFGGSGNINAKNQMIFENVPPGRYVVRGQPNPSTGNQVTEPVTIDLMGGQSAEVTLKAR